MLGELWQPLLQLFRRDLILYRLDQTHRDARGYLNQVKCHHLFNDEVWDAVNRIYLCQGQSHDMDAVVMTGASAIMLQGRWGENDCVTRMMSTPYITEVVVDSQVFSKHLCEIHASVDDDLFFLIICQVVKLVDHVILSEARTPGQHTHIYTVISYLTS